MHQVRRDATAISFPTATIKKDLPTQVRFILCGRFDGCAVPQKVTHCCGMDHGWMDGGREGTREWSGVVGLGIIVVALDSVPLGIRTPKLDRTALRTASCECCDGLSREHSILC